MKFDIQTLVFILSLTCLAQVVAVFVQYKVNRVHGGIGWWLLGSASVSMGFILLSLSNHRSLGVLGMFGNPLLIFARICVVIGMARFLERRVHLGVVLGTFLVVVAVYHYFLILHPDIVARTVIVSSAIAVFSFLVGFYILTSNRKGFELSARFTASIFLAHGTYLLAVALFTVLTPPVHTYQEFSLVQVSVFVVPTITTTLWTFGLILMVNQRLDYENAQEREKLKELFHSRIRERKLAEETRAGLEARNRQLQKAESLGRMAGAIAHNFNNQLQAVMGSLELAGEAGDNPWLDKAKRATERAAGVSRMMLAYLGKTSSVQEQVWLADLCRLSLSLVLGALPRDIRFEMDCPSPGPVVLADGNQVQEMLAGLITNAMEAHGEAPGRIRFALRVVPAGEIPQQHRVPVDWNPSARNYACMEVMDDGAGIAPEDMENIFDPFFSTKFTGRGLGLSVVLGRVQAHGGAVSVESEVGHGSTFRIYLPALEGGTPGGLMEALPVRSPSRKGAILLVDDDEMVLLTTGILVEQLGYPLLKARGGKEAVAIFRDRRDEIRCVITDLSMPGMDGWETLAALRALDPGLPVILASGYDMGQVLAGQHPERPQAFLGKPFDLQQLRLALEGALG